MATNLGKVLSVDKDKGTALVAMFNGLKPEATYSGLAPWPGDTVRVDQTGPAQWVISGSSLGERSSFGPNLIENPSGHIPGVPLLTDGGFESGTDLWVASTNTSIAQSATQARTGSNSLRLTRNTSTGTAEANVAIGNAYPATQGRAYILMAWFRAGTTGRSCQTEIQFYDSANTLLDTYTSPSVTDSSGSWAVEAWVTAPAPAGTVKMRAFLRVLSAAATEIHYVDDVALREAVPGAMLSGAKTWLFDTTTESWGTSTFATISQSTIGQLSGAGCLLFTATLSGYRYAYSPDGTSGQVVVAGKSYTGFAFIKPVTGGGTQRVGYVSINWFNSGGTFLSSNDGAHFTIVNGVWTQLLVNNVTAPAGAAYASLVVNVLSAGIGQQWYVDTGVIVIPPTCRIRRNLNTTYTYGGTDIASIQLTALASGVIISQFFTGINNDSTGAAAINPGDYLATSLDYINDASNSANKNAALVATWYDSMGSFIGITLGSTPITSNPGTGWLHASEVFKAPDLACFFRLRVIFLAGAAGDTLYVANVTVKEAELSPKRIATQGAIAPFDTGVSTALDVTGSYGSVWVTAGLYDTIATGVTMPVTVTATLSGSLLTNAGQGNAGARIIVSFDSGVTWHEGPATYGFCDVGVTPQLPVTASITATERPVGDILIAAQRWTEFNSTDLVYSNAKWTIMPAKDVT